MKLDRNINPDGKGKYALVKLRDIGFPFAAQNGCALIPFHAIDFGTGTDPNCEDPGADFFVIRIKDKYAPAALIAYAAAASADDPEYAAEIHALSEKARLFTPKRKPD